MGERVHHRACHGGLSVLASVSTGLSFFFNRAVLPVGSDHRRCDSARY
jgi:hypothetical protein